MSSGDAPQTPDYTAAANAQAKGNLDLAKYAMSANRYNTVTPYGKTTWEQTGGGPQYNMDAYNKALQTWQSTPQAVPKYTTNENGERFQDGYEPGRGAMPQLSQFLISDDAPTYLQRVELAPEQQKLLDLQNAQSLQLGQLSGDQMERVRQGLATPFSMQGVTDVQQAAEKAITDRLDKQWMQRDQENAAQLRAQGLTPGMEAYDNAMRNFNQGRNDAYQQAVLAGIQTMPQTYALAKAAYTQPLDLYNALRTGQQINNPSAPTGASMATPAGANLLGAAQAAGQYGANLWSAQQAANSSMMGGLMGLGGNLGAAYLRGLGGAGAGTVPASSLTWGGANAAEFDAMAGAAGGAWGGAGAGAYGAGAGAAGTAAGMEGAGDLLWLAAMA